VKILGRLSLAAVLVAYGEVMLGSWTRINGAGMTCPDYPLCHGEFIPSMGGGTIWEWTHRLTAALLSLLVLGVLATAWRNRGTSPFITAAAWTIGALFAFQVFLGAATVHLSNSPISVVWHWGAAMGFVAALACMTIFAYTAEGRSSLSAPGRGNSLLLMSLAVTTIVAFATMCVGAYVSSSGAGLACRDIPGCAGSVVVYTPGQYVQMVHRFIAVTCLLGAVLSFALVWGLGASPRVRLSTSVGLGLVFVQIVLGLLNVALRLPIDLREAHAANATLVFLAFISATALAALDGERVERYARAR
jgi:heme a synthase